MIAMGSDDECFEKQTRGIIHRTTKVIIFFCVCYDRYLYETKYV